MGEDRLGDDEIERNPEPGAREIACVQEARTLALDELAPDLALDSLLDQPLLGLDAEIAVGQEIHEKELAGPQRAAANVEQRVLLPQPEQRHEGELHMGENIVGL